MLRLFLFTAISADVFSVVLTTDCDNHEEYSKCINSGCFPHNCSQLGYPMSCDDPKPEDCIGGYVCESGYLRADNGTCILTNQCPSCNGDPHAESGCGTFCETCANYNTGPVACRALCILNGCQCRTGYIYDQNRKKCVLPKQCTPTCKTNEVYSDCVNGGCDARICSQLGKPVPCVKISRDACVKGCVCEDGYLRADNGTCIPVKECPSCGDDPNAESGCGTFCEKCSNYNKGPVPCPRICKLNGCQCKAGYIYDQNRKKCVLPKECTPTCKANEVYSDCVNGGCEARNCSQLGKPVPCVKMSPDACVKGCVCEDGYLRAYNGTCIPVKECPSCGDDPNAESGCGTFCENCSNYKKGPIACPEICMLNGCQCKTGYIYDQNRKMCVLPEQCTPTCKVNEVYSDCVNGGCDARNCSQLGRPVPCVKMSPDACVRGCLCEDGYLRADNGTCIPIKECSTCGGDPNAESGCGTFCEKCSNYNTGPVPCPRICKLNGCQCKAGYIYDQNRKKCVLPKECTPTCKANEVYSDCVNGGCEARNCSQLGKPVPCVKMSPDACVKGCVCEDGYLRAYNGTCIPVKECPSCGDDPNAESGCDTFCENCSNYKKGPIACPEICMLNGCQCKTGYIYDQNRKMCVLPEQCTPTCKVNEVYSDCVNGGCDARNCSQLGRPVPCVKMSPDACVRGCLCEDGYLRADNGTCIPIKECSTCGGDPNAESGCGTFCEKCSNYNTGPVPCPRICKLNGCQCKAGYIYDQNRKKCVLPKECTPTCKANEVYSDCVNGGCEARNCSQLGKPVPCVKMSPDACVKGCVCEDGYLRAYNGTCIPVKECPSCGDDPNAESGCGTFCENCSNYKKGPIACPEICMLNGCQCKTGYIYDQNRKMCVLPEQCTPTCKVNEVYSDCVNGGCDARNCTQLGNPVPCVRLRPEACVKGCVCAPDYLRAKNGTCIPVKQCPTCGGDPNAESGCGVFCDRCSGPIPCPKICKVNGCQCKKGHIYDQNTEKCVLPKHCTPTCKSHEVYSDCINGGCQARNCTQLGKPVPCVLVAKGACIKGCICESGYLRADNGTCIPEDQCQAQCRSGEVYSQCANTPGMIQHCSQYDEATTSCSRTKKPKKCKAACICKDGYLRNKKGVCIPRDECPEAKTTTTTVSPGCDSDED